MLNGRTLSGFTLLEVLFAILVLAIGLLGLAGLQVTGLRNNHSAFHRSQATLLAYDILDVLRANRQAARNGDYNINLTEESPSDSSRCGLDLNRWITELHSRLPQGDGSVQVANDHITITVQWVEHGENESMQRFVVESQI